MTEALYGEAEAIDRLVERWRGRIPPRPGDAALPSATLCSSPTPTWCASRASGRWPRWPISASGTSPEPSASSMSCPSIPSSSDDGFSVIDYRAVDPALGTWDDIARLGGASA